MPHASLTDDAKQRKIAELTRLFLHQHYCENDTELLLSHLDDAFSWFGAGEHEYAVDPATVIRTFRAFAGRVPRCEIGEEQYDVIRPMPDLFICTGMLWVATVPDSGICLRVHQRITTVFRWTAQGPRCCHLHLSNPYSEMINPLRNAKRRKGERVCPICGAEYQAHGKNSYCSEACRREGRRLSLVKSEAKRKERRMQDKAKKDPRGGARPGAGRKKVERIAPERTPSTVASLWPQPNGRSLEKKPKLWDQCEQTCGPHYPGIPCRSTFSRHRVNSLAVWASNSSGTAHTSLDSGIW